MNMQLLTTEFLCNPPRASFLRVSVTTATGFPMRHTYEDLRVDNLPNLACEAEAYRQILNQIHPHEALGLHGPAEVHHDAPRKSRTRI
jgi:hypothetical protein